jgi:hypothetical protein
MQPPQPLCEQRAGYVRKTALKFVGAADVGKKLADDKYRPAVGTEPQGSIGRIDA